MKYVNIISAQQKHISQICEIYNYYVKHSIATFSKDEYKENSFREILLENQRNNIPFLVAVNKEDEVIGYSYLQPYNSERAGYKFTFSNAIYLNPDHLGKGIGNKLLVDLISAAKSTNIHSIISLIAIAPDEDNNASSILHNKHCFKNVGRSSEVGRKFEQWIDVITM